MPSHATVVAYLALFVGLGAGGAWAAGKIGSEEIERNAIRAKHIKKNQVKAKHIKKNQVRAKHIKDGQVGAAEIADGAVAGAEIADGAVAGAEIANAAVTAEKLVDGPGSGIDADTLDGVGADGFVAAERVLHGSASSEADLALLFEWPGTGIEVRTRDTDAGDGILDLRIVNTGAGNFKVDGNALPPGGSLKTGGLLGSSDFVVDNDGIGLMMRLNCFANVQTTGDDGYWRCMGITAGPE